MISQEERLRIIVDKHKPLYTKNTSLEGFSLTVYPHVFMPNGMSTKIFKKIILKLDQKYDSVLDMGCGSGILSLIMSKCFLKTPHLENINFLIHSTLRVEVFSVW